MRSKFVLAVSIALMASVSACSKKAEGQTVAIVNGEEITAAELNAEITNAKIPEGTDKAEARSRVLQAMIDRRLLAQQAKADGIDRSPEFLNRLRRATDDLLISMLASRQIDTAKLPSDSEIQQFQATHPWIFAQREQWNLDQLRFQMPTDAATRSRLEQAKTLEAVAQVLTDSGVPFTRQKNKLDTAVIPQNLYGQLASASRGSEPFIIPVGDQAVASVILSREPAPITGAEARPIAVAAMRREQATTLMQNRLKSVRDAAKIEYKEGYAPPTPKK